MTLLSIHHGQRHRPGELLTYLLLVFSFSTGTSPCFADQGHDPEGVAGPNTSLAAESSQTMQADARQLPHYPMTIPEQSHELTMLQAEQIALRNNSRVLLAHLEALVQEQVVHEDLAAELPQVVADATAAKADTGSRVGAAVSLNDSRVFTHAGVQMTVSQMITDFGHTSNLLASARLSERAKQADEQATRQEIVFCTDQIFLATLRSQRARDAAKRDLVIRQTTQRWISETAGQAPQTHLDRGSAEEDVLKASVQLLEAETDADLKMATLDEMLGLNPDHAYVLLAEDRDTPTPTPNSTLLLGIALRQRPDVLASTLRLEAAKRFSTAQMDRLRPMITAIGTVGGEPIRPGQYFISSWNGAVGVNVSIPLFDGLFSKAQTKEAELHTSEVSEQSRRLRDRVSHDVTAAWIRLQGAHQRCILTSQMVKQAREDFDFATSQYQLGLATFVELSHAERQQREAETNEIDADYLYRLSDVTLAFELGGAQ